MRSFVLAGTTALMLAAAPAALNAQGAPQTSAQANAPPPAPSTTVMTRPSGQALVTSNNPGNMTPPPASALNKTYPLCSRTLQDNCRNPGEGGAGGR